MKKELYPYPEEVARRVVGAIGPQSATAKALAELERRRAAGERVQLWLSGGDVIVGPMPDVH